MERFVYLHLFRFCSFFVLSFSSFTSVFRGVKKKFFHDDLVMPKNITRPLLFYTTSPSLSIPPFYSH